jgi:hypothetical protein
MADQDEAGTGAVVLAGEPRQTHHQVVTAPEDNADISPLVEPMESAYVRPMSPGGTLGAPILQPEQRFAVPQDSLRIRVNVEWTIKSRGVVCDLDLKMASFDERVRVDAIVWICGT